LSGHTSRRNSGSFNQGAGPVDVFRRKNVVRDWKRRLLSRKPGLDRRGRATLVWALAVFAALQLSVAAAIELCLPQWRDPLYGDKLQQLQKRIAKAPANSPLVLMLGTSRTNNGLDARSVEQQLARYLNHPVTVYNFGIPGAGPFTELVYFKRLLTEGIRPDLVLIEVLPAMFSAPASFDIDASPAERVWLNEIPLIERHTQSHFPEQRLRRQWWLAWFTPVWAHRFPILRTIWPAFIPPDGRGHYFSKFDEHGWSAVADEARTPQRHEFGLEAARRTYEPRLARFEFGSAACQALEELIDACERERIPAALVLMPEGDTFRGWYSERAWQQLDAYLERLSSRFAIPLINGREWIAEAQFLDSHHLLASGARSFSQRLSRHAAPLVERTEMARQIDSGIRLR
jgi:hypothetical protein